MAATAVYQVEGKVGDQVRVDLDALGRFLPQLRELAEQVKAGIPGQFLHQTNDLVPSLAAAQDMSETTLPALKRTVADQFTKVAERVENARLEFLTSDEQIPVSASSAPAPQPAPTQV